jgi:cell division protein ZipA
MTDLKFGEATVWEHITRQYQSLLPILGLVAVLLIIAIGVWTALARKRNQAELETEHSIDSINMENELEEPVEVESEVITLTVVKGDKVSEGPLLDADLPSEEEQAVAEMIAEAGEAAAMAMTHDEPQQEQISFTDENTIAWKQAVKESLHKRLGKERSSQPTKLDPGFIVINVMGHRSMKYLGTTLVAILKAHGLYLNNKHVFEYANEEGINFMVASAVNPGTFPMVSINTFTTPGLSFILDLAQVKQPKKAFMGMLTMVNKVAAELDGDILDEERQRLTQAGIDGYMLRINTAEQLREQQHA